MGIFDEFNKKEKPVFTGLKFGFGSGGGGAESQSVSGGVVASGTQPGDGYTYHYFKNPGGSFTVTGASIVCEMLCVAGGGAGGARVGGGGGAGGIAVAGIANPMTVPVGTHTVVVGAGGDRTPSSNPTFGGRGGDTTFGSSPDPFYVHAEGGGGGGGEPTDPPSNRTPGGSGGGSQYNYHNGTGTQPDYNSGKPWVTNYGNSGGHGTPSPTHNSGGGGGAGGPGGTGTASPDARGAAGNSRDFPQFPVPKYMPAPDPYRPGINPLPGIAYGGGGGAGDYPPSPSTEPSILPQNMPASATNGGGGVGGPPGNYGNGTPGIDGLGGGGGGATGESSGPLGGNGGDGILVIRYQSL